MAHAPRRLSGTQVADWSLDALPSGKPPAIQFLGVSRYPCPVCRSDDVFCFDFITMVLLRIYFRNCACFTYSPGRDPRITSRTFSAYHVDTDQIETISDGTKKDAAQGQGLIINQSIANQSRSSNQIINDQNQSTNCSAI